MSKGARARRQRAAVVIPGTSEMLSPDYARLLFAQLLWRRHNDDTTEARPAELDDLGEWILDPECHQARLDVLVLGAHWVFEMLLLEMEHAGVDVDELLSRVGLHLADLERHFPADT